MLYGDRKKAQEERYLIMCSTWEHMAQEEIVRMVGQERAYAWPRPDTASNPLLLGANQLSMLYDRETVFSSSTSSDEVNVALNSLFSGANFGGLMQNLQPKVIGIGDYAIRYDVFTKNDGSKGLTLHPVPPHLLDVVPDPSDPRQPLEVTERVMIEGRTAERRWTPEFVETKKYGAESTIEYHEQRGCPWVIYHGYPDEHMWTYNANSEVVRGTLHLACLRTFALHATLDAAHPQRNAIGLEIMGSSERGGGVSGDPTSRGVTTDPTVVNMWAPIEGITSGWSLHQWAPAMDVASLYRLIADYQAGLLEQYRVAGITARRTSDGNAPSGTSLVVAREVQRDLQRRFASIFRPFDSMLAAKVAYAAGLSELDTKWSVNYGALPPDADEVDLLIKMLANGLITLEQAQRMLSPFVV